MHIIRIKYQIYIIPLKIFNDNFYSKFLYNNYLQFILMDSNLIIIFFKKFSLNGYGCELTLLINIKQKLEIGQNGWPCLLWRVRCRPWEF